MTPGGVGLASGWTSSGLGSAAGNPWVQFLARRLVGLAGILVALVVLTFLMIPLIPGDVAVNMAGPDATSADVERIHRQLGLDRPLPEQFVNYIGLLAHGDLGNSYLSSGIGTLATAKAGQPVASIIAARLPASTQLAGLALLAILLIGIPGGILIGAITREGRHPSVEFVFTAVTSVGGALPQFLVATLLVFVFAVTLQLLPAGGADRPESLVLPVLAIALPPAFVLARIVRIETLTVLRQDYIRTARGKRLPPLHLYARHVLPNVLTAALTLAGLVFAHLIAGAVLVENIFARVGIGTALVTAITGKDYPVIQGIILVLGCAVVFVNMIVDVILALVDPRSLTGQA